MENAIDGIQAETRQGLNIKIEIRVKYKGRGKFRTFVHGISREFDKKKILRHFIEKFHCKGKIIKDDDYGEVIKFYGDYRNQVYEFITEFGFANTDEVRVRIF